MAIEHAIWRVGTLPTKLQEATLIGEAELEKMIAANVGILNDRWLLIGRQVGTDYGKLIDLLALDSTGSVIIIELKKDMTPREVVAQTLDYASWIRGLDASRIADIFERYGDRVGHSHGSLDQAFQAKFGVALTDDMLDGTHQMVIVASQLDASTERIVRYLADYDVAINVVFFKVFQDGEQRYLSRAWFFDPAETQEQAATRRGKEPWNGEYYVAFGHEMGRHWDDARKYGFVGGGGGAWYSRTLHLLQPGDRIWVHIPKAGYVGVGIVEEPAVKVDEFMVETESGPKPILESEVNAPYRHADIDGQDTDEYLVRVKWLKALPFSQAKWEVGFFSNQNTVARPTAASWSHTVDRLKQLFGIA